MESVKILVQDGYMASVTCPACKKSIRISVAPYKEKNHIIKLRCTCGGIFLGLLEFRKQRRRLVNLKGTYRTIYQQIVKEGNMLVSDISDGGLKCMVSDEKGLQEGHLLGMEYRLNDIKRSTIKKKGVIRHKSGLSVGCEFIEV